MVVNVVKVVMNSLELKVPPPAVALGLALPMWLVSSWGPPLAVPCGLRVGLAIAMVAVGQSISLSAIVLFRRAQTTVNPLKPGATSRLVSGGVYRFTRNPMYIGLLLTLAAWAVFLASPWAFAALPVYVLYMNRFQIEPEERALASLFGGEFAEYRARVRRWV